MVDAREISKYFGTFKALDRVSCEVYEGEKVVIIGPSGSGKSTLLRSINGLERVDRGRILVDGVDIHDPKTDINKVREEVGMVFQAFNLFPHKTVVENLTLAQVVVRKRRDEAVERAMGLLAR
jgi:polar amino acid transport system ATP-binding protein